MTYQSKKLKDILLQQGDYDVLNKENEAFGFFSFKKIAVEQKYQDNLLNENKDSVFSLSENKYERIELIKCNVNIYALKMIIRNNLKSIREIEIENCKFYFNDEDAQKATNQVTNLHMFSEINFIWLIETFKFQDLDSLEIKLSEDPNIKTSLRTATMVLKNTAKVSDAKDIQKEVDNKAEHNLEPILDQETAQELFKCEKKCGFITYEYKDLKKFFKSYSKKKISKFTQDLIWGDLLYQEKYYDQLYNNILEDIQENIRIYKKYTKNAFTDGKLIIYGDVLKNGLSRNQLYNVIQMNCQKINGIIFKDCGKIYPLEFSDLMTQLFLINMIDSIAFISSVIDQQTLYELQYLVKMKEVKFFVLHKAYFLKTEISNLLDLNEDDAPIEINNFRFTILDISIKKTFEFTPYSFNLESIYNKLDEQLMDVEKTYQFQNFHPKQIQDQIVFYSGKNVSIRSDFDTENILFDYWDILQGTKDLNQDKIDAFKSNQDKLIKLIDYFIELEDVNILNYNLLITLINMIIEQDIKDSYLSLIKNLKSVQCLQDHVSLSLAEKLFFAEEKHLNITYAYIKGFTRVKDFNIYYVIQNETLFKDISENSIQTQEKLTSQMNILQISDYIDKQSKEFEGNFNFLKLKDINLTTVDLNDSKLKLLNKIIIDSKNLKTLKLCDCHLTNEKLQFLDFSKVSPQIETLDISYNSNIESFEFLNVFFKQAKKLKKLNLHVMDLSDQQTESADFSLVSSTLQELKLQHNKLQGIGFMNKIFQTATNLQILDLLSCGLDDEKFQSLNLPKGLKKLDISYNTVQLITVIEHIGKIEDIEIEDLSLIYLPGGSALPDQYKQYLKAGSLKGLRKLKNVLLQKNDIFDINIINMILNNSDSIEELAISDQKLDNSKFMQLSFDKLSSLTCFKILYGANIDNFSFLTKMFECCKNLKKLYFNESNIDDYRFPSSIIEQIPTDLEEFYFNGNTYNSISDLLNKLFVRCQKLKVLHLERNNIQDYQITSVDFKQLSFFLKDFNISTNPSIKSYGFLIDVFKFASELKKLNLSNNNATPSDVDISLFEKAFCLEKLDAENNTFYTDEFINNLNKSRKLFIDIKSFEVTYIAVDKKDFINYFRVFDKYNLSNLNSLDQQAYKEFLKDNNEETSQLDISLNSNGDEAQQEEQNNNQKQGQKGKKAKKKQIKVYKNSKEAKFSNHINPLYFYTLFNFFDQIIDDEECYDNLTNDAESVISFANYTKAMETLGMIESQNVYMHTEYYLFHLINTQFSNKISRNLRELLGQEKNFTTQKISQFLTEINLKNKKIYKNLDFLQIFFDKCENIQIIDLSKMNVSKKINLNFKNMPKLVEFNFNDQSKKNKECNAEFIAKIIKNAPQLQKLNLKNSNIKNSSLLDFSNNNELLEFNFSGNKKAENYEFMNVLFKNNQKLKKLYLSSLSDNISQIEFSLVPTMIEEIDLSENKQGIVDIINQCIFNCQSLQILNISNCGINYQDNFRICYTSISPQLIELNFSSNCYYYDMNFIPSLLERCPKLLKLDISNQVFDLTYDCVNSLGFSEHSLQEFKFCGNKSYNNYDFIKEMILTSKGFKKLCIQDIDLHTTRLTNFYFDQIGPYIEELDISNHSYMTDISFLNHFNASNNFYTLIANNTVITNQMMNTVNIDTVFKNLKRLEFEQCYNFINLKFFNQIFKTATQLEILNMSDMKIEQKLLNKIDFKLVPSTLRQFIFNKNDLITNFGFLTDLFTSTQNSLEDLSLSKCDLKAQKLKEADFSLISSKIQKIDLSENDNLDNLEFLVPFFKQSHSTNLNTLKISKISFEMHLTLQKYSHQIQDLDYPFQNIDMDHFSYQENQKYQLSINVRKLLNYLQKDAHVKSFSQQIWQNQTARSKAFKNILSSLMEQNMTSQSIKTTTHFLYLMLREVKFQCKQYQPFNFIFSPYSLFQQSQLIECNYDNNSNQNVIPDSYNLAFFTLNVLNSNTEYIFGYDKFFFENFQEFYIQRFPKNTSDLEFIINLKKKMDEKKIKRAFLPIKLNLDFSKLQKLNMNEFDILFYLNCVPPAEIYLSGMTVQFVKSWFAIQHSSPLSVKTTIDVKYDQIQNTSIANYLILIFSRIYIRNFEGKTLSAKIKKLLSNIGYSFFNVFGSPPRQYKFDHTVILLNEQLHTFIKQGKENFLRLLYPIYLFVCLFAVLYFSFNKSQCGNSLSMYSYITYAGFGFVSLFLEFYIFSMCVKYMSHLVPEVKPDCRVTFPNPLINKVKTFIMDIEWLNQKLVNYILLFVSSQLSRFDFLANIGFIIQAYQCSDKIIWILGIASLSTTVLTSIVFFIQNLIGQKTYNLLITGSIDTIYQLCNVLEFQAAAEILDFISPTNSVIIFKKMVNQRVFTSSLRILFQDIPLIVLKALFLYNQGTLNASMIFSIVSSSIMALISFNKFLTITPSRLGQEEFTKLNKQKRKEKLPQYITKLASYEAKICKFNLYEMIKCIKSPKFYIDQIKAQNQTTSLSEIKKEIKLINDIRKFKCTQDLIQDFFGNTQYNDPKMDIPKPNNQQNFQELEFNNLINQQLNKQQEVDDKNNQSTVKSHVKSQTDLLLNGQQSPQKKENKIELNKKESSLCLENQNLLKQ
ncbi:transmembrane protein, putative (macronuclear) [Tetrahymena thermophila SB210]|uniref:Transmembrane protein, putative n=1 Tax=Tetrahymena thermophila (strain SB210) TaxID=312017 RepID=Q247Q7_TETTS|nr:transmembrane protein, putative [Tetrahymena thermophila SB210]EAS04043.2 transmembrane protein, putative [Tetrahymena thermophila SB210]|eukprot:XP_001024288.2 transmembrane protein, putative [Tetrahymena thermophila SB210]